MEVGPRLESGCNHEKWINSPLDSDGVGAMPSALIYAAANGLDAILEILLRFGADPFQMYAGTNQFNGWLKPACKLSAQLMSRVGRFKGTMLGEKYQRSLELLQVVIITIRFYAFVPHSTFSSVLFSLLC